MRAAHPGSLTKKTYKNQMTITANSCASGFRRIYWQSYRGVRQFVPKKLCTLYSELFINLSSSLDSDLSLLQSVDRALFKGAQGAASLPIQRVWTLALGSSTDNLGLRRGVRCTEHERPLGDARLTQSFCSYHKFEIQY